MLEHLPGKYLLEGCTLGSMLAIGYDRVTGARCTKRRNREGNTSYLGNGYLIPSIFLKAAGGTTMKHVMHTRFNDDLASTTWSVDFSEQSPLLYCVKQ